MRERSTLEVPTGGTPAPTMMVPESTWRRSSGLRQPDGKPTSAVSNIAASSETPCSVLGCPLPAASTTSRPSEVAYMMAARSSGHHSTGML